MIGVYHEMREAFRLMESLIHFFFHKKERSADGIVDNKDCRIVPVAGRTGTYLCFKDEREEEDTMEEKGGGRKRRGRKMRM